VAQKPQISRRYTVVFGTRIASEYSPPANSNFRGFMGLPSSGHKGVSRVDSEKRNSHGWLVRVRFKGESLSRFFTDSVYGGKEKSLRAAVRGRNELEREMGKPRTDRTLIVQAAQDTTGVPGVKLTMKEGREVFEVTWCPRPNVVSRTSVSIAKYGAEAAFHRACRIRQSKERALYGSIIPYDAPPDEPSTLPVRTSR
jgi:hypothetical protein